MSSIWNTTSYTWDDANMAWNLIRELSGGGGDFLEEIYKYDDEKKKKLIKLILKVHGNTITETKQKEIKQYKIKASDIKLTVEKVLGVELVTENVKF